MAIEKKAKDAAPAPGDKQKALETAISQIEKQFGKGAVMRLGQNATMNVEAIPTGSLSLDMALGIGGLPRGRIVEIYACRRRSPETGRLCGFHRCGARFGPRLCQKSRRGYR